MVSIVFSIYKWVEQARVLFLPNKLAKWVTNNSYQCALRLKNHQCLSRRVALQLDLAKLSSSKIAPIHVCVRRVNLTTKFRFQNIKLRSFEFQKQYRRIPTHKECTNAKNFAYKRCMLGGEICPFDVIKHEGYFSQLDSRTAKELKVDAYIELHNVLVELYLHKRCNLTNLQKFLKLFKTLIVRVFFF